MDRIARDDRGEGRGQAQGVVAAADGVMAREQARLLEKPGPALVGGFEQRSASSNRSRFAEADADAGFVVRRRRQSRPPCTAEKTVSC